MELEEMMVKIIDDRLIVQDDQRAQHEQRAHDEEDELYKELLASWCEAAMVESKVGMMILENYRTEREQLRIEATLIMGNVVDSYIRTRRRFNSAQPLKYKCQISTMFRDANVLRAWVTVLEPHLIVDPYVFLRNNDRFIVYGNDMIGVSSTGVGKKTILNFFHTNDHRNILKIKIFKTFT